MAAALVVRWAGGALLHCAAAHVTACVQLHAAGTVAWFDRSPAGSVAPSCSHAVQSMPNHCPAAGGLGGMPFTPAGGAGGAAYSDEDEDDDGPPGELVFVCFAVGW